MENSPEKKPLLNKESLFMFFFGIIHLFCSVLAFLKPGLFSTLCSFLPDALGVCQNVPLEFQYALGILAGSFLTLLSALFFLISLFPHHTSYRLLILLGTSCSGVGFFVVYLNHNHFLVYLIFALIELCLFMIVLWFLLAFLWENVLRSKKQVNNPPPPQLVPLKNTN